MISQYDKDMCCLYIAEVWQKMVPPRVNAILTPDSTGSKLILDYVQSYNDLSYRRRPASEILWAMVKANGKRTN